MKTLLRILMTTLAVTCLPSAGAQIPAGDAVSDWDYAVGVVERACTGFPDKTAGREGEYAALMERLEREIAAGRGIDAEGIAPDVRIPLPLPQTLTDNVDTWVRWVAEDMKTKN